MDADKFIREMLGSGMIDGVRLTIEFVSGFELFNTRPYHNYETWSNGYRVKIFDNGCKNVICESYREDLDEALIEIREKFKNVRNK